MNAYILLKYDDQFLNLPAIFATIQIPVSGWLRLQWRTMTTFELNTGSLSFKELTERAHLFSWVLIRKSSLYCVKAMARQCISVFHKRGGVVEISQTL